MRRLGERIAKEALLAATPVRGLLQLSASTPDYEWHDRGLPLLAGLVAPGQVTWLIPPLHHARVTRIYKGALVINGFEEHDLGRRRVERYRQAWWCRVVVDKP